MRGGPRDECVDVDAVANFAHSCVWLCPWYEVGYLGDIKLVTWLFANIAVSSSSLPRNSILNLRFAHPSVITHILVQSSVYNAALIAVFCIVYTYIDIIKA